MAGGVCMQQGREGRWGALGRGGGVGRSWGEAPVGGGTAELSRSWYLHGGPWKLLRIQMRDSLLGDRAQMGVQNPQVQTPDGVTLHGVWTPGDFVCGVPSSGAQRC